MWDADGVAWANDNNDVDVIAADIDGFLKFSDLDDLTVGTVTPRSWKGMPTR